MKLRMITTLFAVALGSAGCQDDIAEVEVVTLLEDDQGVVEVDAAIDPMPTGTGEAWVYLDDPVTNAGELTQVTLAPSVFDDGRLTSDWVEVFNCLNEEGGVSAMPNFGPFDITVFLCNEVQSVRPDDDGNYLSIRPPEDDTDPNDPFAEVMMYHHVNLVHDYFKNTHGFAELDFALPALVNVQFKTEPPIPVPGVMPGPDGWIPFSNAAFFPKENWQAFAAQFGLPPRDKDSIIFFQGDKDFAYDARVIYHEYTHAVVGTGRLNGFPTADKFGLSNAPGSMNEGLADYFAGSIADDPVIGAYVGVMGLGLRDLSEARRCPEDSIDEIHAHGQLIGSTMWAVREAVGAEIADGIAFRALEQFSRTTDHQQAAELILAEAVDISDEVGNQVREIFEGYGFIDCERSRAWERFRAAQSRDRIPHIVEGSQSAGRGGLDEGVPAYKQFFIDVDADTAAVQLSWSVGTSGGGFGGFGGGGGEQASPLSISVRKNSPIEIGYTPRMTVAEDARYTPELANGGQRIVLSGDCFPADGGRVHTLFLNGGQSAAQIERMDIEVLDAIPEDGLVVNCSD